MALRFVSQFPWRLARAVGLVLAVAAMSAVGVFGALTNMAPPRAIATAAGPVTPVTQALPTAAPAEARKMPCRQQAWPMTDRSCETWTSDSRKADVPAPAASPQPSAAPPAVAAPQPVKAVVPPEQPKKTAPAAIEPAKAAPPKVESAAVPARIEPPKVDPAKTEPVKTETPSPEPAREPTQTAAAEVETAPPVVAARRKPRPIRTQRVAVADHGVEGPAVAARPRRTAAPAPFPIREFSRR